MKFEIKSRFTMEIIFTAEIDAKFESQPRLCTQTANFGNKMRSFYANQWVAQKHTKNGIYS